MRFSPFEFDAIPAQMRRLAGILLLCTLIPAEALACACGCAVFDVGSTALLPKEGDHGGAVYFEWDYSNQNTNWSGTSKAPAANNSDKNILTNWLVVGANYMINRDWGVTGTDPNRQPLLPHRHQFSGYAGGSPKVYRLLHRRHRTHGDVHRLLERYVEGNHVRHKIADRQLHGPRF